MEILVIDGNLQKFIQKEEEGYISFDVPDLKEALSLAETFVKYGKTVVINS